MAFIYADEEYSDELLNNAVKDYYKTAKIIVKSNYTGVDERSIPKCIINRITNKNMYYMSKEDPDDPQPYNDLLGRVRKMVKEHELDLLVKGE